MESVKSLNDFWPEDVILVSRVTFFVITYAKVLNLLLTLFSPSIWYIVRRVELLFYFGRHSMTQIESWSWWKLIIIVNYLKNWIKKNIKLLVIVFFSRTNFLCIFFIFPSDITFISVRLRRNHFPFSGWLDSFLQRKEVESNPRYSPCSTCHLHFILWGKTPDFSSRLEGFRQLLWLAVTD